MLQNIRKTMRKAYRKVKRKLFPKEITEAEKKKLERQEKNIVKIMEKSGWSREETVANVTRAKERCGITYFHYNKYNFHQIPENQQKEKYEKILAKIERMKDEREKIIQKVMEKTGWDHEYATNQIKEAQKRTGCQYKEYLLYKFYEMDKETQDSLFLITMSKKIAKKYDINPMFNKMLCDKAMTNEHFSDYLKRLWCVNTKISKEDFIEKFIDSGRIIYKPLAGNCGRGVEAFDVNADNIVEVYDKVATYPDGVIEQYVVQHPQISALAPSSVNTVRIVTISSNCQPITANGENVDFAYAALRIGGGTTVVDNFHSGGMVAAVNLENGEVLTDAADMEGNVFKEHPLTGITFKGFTIPLFKEAVAMVEEALKTSKIEGYLGWDIAITETGPVLIEINRRPGVVLLTTPYIAEKKGMKHVMEKYL